MTTGHLAGRQNIVTVNQDIIGPPLILATLVGASLYSVGAILFGIAISRSGTLRGCPLRTFRIPDLQPGADDRSGADPGRHPVCDGGRMDRMARLAAIPGPDRAPPEHDLARSSRMAR